MAVRGSVMSLFEMPRLWVLVVAMASVGPTSALALRSAASLAEFAVPSVDAVLAPGCARSSVELESG